METSDRSSEAVSLRPALDGVIESPNNNLGLRTPSESPSEEDYDEAEGKRVNDMLRRRSRKDGSNHVAEDTSGNTTSGAASDYPNDNPGSRGTPGRPQLRNGMQSKKSYVIASDDTELRDVLRRGLEREKEKTRPSRKEKLRSMVFTRQFSAFDRQNRNAANSPFQGFYVLFWIAVAFLIIKMGAENWRKTGNVLGTNEIMKYMFRRDVLVLLISDGLMCLLTGFGLFLQKLVLKDWIDWNRTGWIIQNVWQSTFIGAVVGLTLIRDWPWTHTVFFVMHGLVMLMKQHSYAFYNGHLSTAYEKRKQLGERLKQLENISPVDLPAPQTNTASFALSTSHLSRRPSKHEYRERRLSITRSDTADDMENISQAIESGIPLNMDQIQLFERMIKWELDALTDEIKGRATDPAHCYPNNLTVYNQYEFICLPTLVYELEYPRSETINWAYVAEKVSAVFGLIFVMIMVSQAYIYPVVIRAVNMKDEGWTLGERFQEFPWMLSDLVFPFMMEYLLVWYLIWEAVLNTLAELTHFADRSFYDAWWNSVSWDQYARDWNRPVHNFLLRHVYHSSISSMRVNKHTATLITFFLSACVHELVMWCIFKKLRGYLLFLQMTQLPLVQLSRTKLLRNRETLGNMMFWIGLLTGPSLLTSLYLIL
ncbi:hypothetical protein PFICI_07207 [Pestalotiopsis fici W106-1]|uniref:O-acyltransferase n=1 Tax=Pestalotiopsis fici (strain W106-1 / CGMCC3.15140) TaxID=1229662 RepID=W3X829_PESFW|nr:uncharacterized protein PFICI_07207 [Pestalotiopsis fici W106-1]ETS82205.1 hypothetical protein PFICI_07207 [Pestalotiopsis fici W106-1]